MQRETFVEPRFVVEHATQQLQQGKRPCGDRKEFVEVRPTDLEIGVVEGAQGSATVRRGGSLVICGIKGEFGPTDSLKPSVGCIDVALHFPEICGLSFVWPQETLNQVRKDITQYIQDQLDCSVPLEQLLIKENEVCWILRIDISLISLDGSIRDVCLLAAVAAISSVNLPETTLGDRITKTEAKRLAISRVPVALTFGVFGEAYRMRMLADPSGAEIAAAETILTIAVDAKTLALLSVIHHGSVALANDLLQSCFDVAAQHAKLFVSLA